MNSPLCHGPFRPALEVRNSSVMRSPYSTTSSSSTSPSSEVSGEPSSPLRAVSPFDSHDPLRISPISPIKPQHHSSRSPASFHPDTGSSRLKRRASQGSILTKPSPVSRFLSRSNASLHLPSFEELGLSSKFSRSDSQSSPPQSRLRLSTGPTASSSLATRASQSSSAGWDSSAKSDYLSALPPTPPDDNDHIAWNPTSDMLLFESHVTRNHAPIVMDEGPNIGNSPARTDGLSSPSDQLSNVSPSSSGGSPGSSDEMDCDHSSWLENSIEATGKSASRNPRVSTANRPIVNSLITCSLELPRRGRQNRLSDAPISSHC